MTPGFFLHALDPDTGYPIESFGDRGTVDLLADFGYEYHPTDGLPSTVGYITNSSPPIVVNGGGRGRQLPRAGLPADAARERAGAHPGL